VAYVIPEGRGPNPQRPLAPIGPRIQDNSYGATSQARLHTHTYSCLGHLLWVM